MSLGIAGIVFWLAVGVVLEDADASARVVLTAGSVVLLVVATWRANRFLLARQLVPAAEVLTIGILTWVLLLIILIWAGIIAALDDLKDEASLSFWLALGAAAGFAALTWLVTGSALRRPLASAAGFLTVCVFALLALALGLLGAFGDGSRNPAAYPLDPPAGIGQDEVQAAYLSDRASLHDGRVKTAKSVRITVGATYTLDAVVCGGASPECAGPVPTATANVEMKTGGRISAWAVPSDALTVAPPDAVVQPVIDAADHATWRWHVTPTRAGEFRVSLHFRVLRGETEEALIPDKLMTVEVSAVESTKDVADIAKAGGGWFKEHVGWIIGLLGALGVTGPMIVNAAKRTTTGAANGPDRNDDAVPRPQP